MTRTRRSNTWNAYRDVLAEGGLTVRVFALWHSPRNLEDAKKLIALIEPLGKPAEGGGDGRLVSGGVKIFADGSGGVAHRLDVAGLEPRPHRDRRRQPRLPGLRSRTDPRTDPPLSRRRPARRHARDRRPGHRLGRGLLCARIAAEARARHAPLDHPCEHPGRARARGHGGDAAGLRRGLPGAVADLHLVDRRHLRRHFRAGTKPPAQSVRKLPEQGHPLGERLGLRRDAVSGALRDLVRRSRASRCSACTAAIPSAAREAVDAHAALRSFTIWAAHQTFMDDIIGSLEPGKRADIAVWDTDFYAAPASAIKDAACLMTIFDGDVVYRGERLR